MDEDLAAPIFGSRQHLPNLVITTVWLGRMLQASEQPEQAAATLVTGFRLAGQVGLDSLATDAAIALRALYSRDAAVVEAAWRKAAGQEPFPAGLRGRGPVRSDRVMQVRVRPPGPVISWAPGSLPE